MKVKRGWTGRGQQRRETEGERKSRGGGGGERGRC